MTESQIQNYITEIHKLHSTGEATEHSYRAELQRLLVQFPDHSVINEPRRIECGAPDLAVYRTTGSAAFTVGHVETKNVGESLDAALKSDQLKRYLSALGNLVLTDFMEFRWFVDGEQRGAASAASLDRDAIEPRKADFEAVIQLLQGFMAHEPEPVADPETLAVRLARLAHMIRDIIVEAFDNDKASRMIAELRSAFARTLIPDLEKPDKTPEFADMYAQTLAYGLFAARVHHSGSEPFARRNAAREIPRTNPFLRMLFETVTGSGLDEEPYAGFVDDIATLLSHADMESILQTFGRRRTGQDPVIHFYETFLAAYDPRLREARGVYYTPEPVVSYMVRSVDRLLKTRFHCPGGLAHTEKIGYKAAVKRPDGKAGLEDRESHRVLILDPACGTGTFLYSVIDHIREEFIRKNNAGMWSGYVREHILPRVFGFELLMAPYAVAHFKLGMQLAGRDLTDKLQSRWAYNFAADERLGVFLTNTLEEAERRTEKLLGPFGIISDEADAAAEIKAELPIMVIIGNPPYSGHSANASWRTVREQNKAKRVPTFIGELIRDYHSVDGKPLGERNPKWLQDDYVKFIRWAQWRIERTGAGVLAFITNHGYLDNPTFRGMRRHLMNSFSEIFVMDLHGNAKKRETAPDGSRDDNVFDIQQGTAIGIFVRRPGHKGSARVFHADLFGPRKAKYAALEEASIDSTEWVEVEPNAPFYLFVPRDAGLEKEYSRAWKITELMPVNSVGIVTARDRLTIHWSPDELWDTVRDFASLPPEQARDKYKLGEDAKDWKVNLAQEDLAQSGPDRSNIVPILYRPFDRRFTYYTANSNGFICRPRPEVMRHMLAGKNIGLSVSRSIEIGRGWEHVFCASNLIQHHTVSLKEVNYLFPLYLYPDRMTNGDLFANGTDRHVNINPSFIAELEKRLKLRFDADAPTGDLKKTVGPEAVFHYIYAVLHSPTYRDRYAEFLRIDFPRIPLTSDPKLFRKLCGLGRELATLHLMDSPELALSNLVTRYPVPGDSRVEKGYPKYSPPGGPDPDREGEKLGAGRVYINPEQYFEGVEPRVWEFYIGGYQVCGKWLKDRRGRPLSYDDLTHYQRMITALGQTLELMEKIDAAVVDWPLG